MTIDDMRAAMTHRIDGNIDQWRLKITPGRDYTSDIMWVHIVIEDEGRVFEAYGVKRWRVPHRGVLHALERIRAAVTAGYMDDALRAFYSRA